MPLLLGMLAALWLGVLTSIHPCPLATNVAAVMFLARESGSPRRTLAAGVLYALGRSAAYVGVALAIVAGGLAIPGVSRTLQYYVGRLLGPLLILVGMSLLGLLPLPRRKPRAKTAPPPARLASAAGMGFVLALSFCPASAAIFFAGLIPLAVRHGSSVWMPVAYGLGTAAPVVACALLGAAGTGALVKGVGRLRRFERWARAGTGVALIGIGVYLSWAHIFAAGS